MRARLTLFSLFLFLASISPVLADDDVNLNTFPSFLAERLGITLFASKLLAGVIVLMLPLIFVLFITKGKNVYATLIVGMPMMGFVTALGWFPVWIFLVTAIIIGLWFADKFGGVLTGRGGD